MRMIPASTRDERGVISVVIALSTATFLFGLGAISVDLGASWRARRHLVTATDAAALAAAQEYAERRAGCGGVAGTFLADNYAEAVITTCTATGTGTSQGTVTVSARAPVPYAFARALGLNEGSVTGSTTAGWAIPTKVRGLRPFGLCRDNALFQTWLANPVGESLPFIILYTKTNPSDCGNNAPGNWGVLNFAGEGPPNQTSTNEWTRFGYSGVVSTGAQVGGNPGTIGNSLSDDLSSVMGETFPIPVFDEVAAQGSNATFRIWGFVGVELLGYDVTGPEALRYIQVKFVDLVVESECCDWGSTETGVHAVRICNTDHGSSEC